jgi:hypothetical protein
MVSWRKSSEYRKWRVAVIRSQRVCKVCGSRRDRHAHHVQDASNHVDKRFDVENGVCLCKRCHSVYHNKFKGSYRRKTTRADFRRFLKLVKYVKSL